MLLYVAVGGLVGSVARYLIAGWIQVRTDSAFPTGTLVVNVLGSLILGFLLRYATGSNVLSAELRTGLTIGFCGAFTTMSTFGYESVTLLGDGEYGPAALYMTTTMLGTVLAVIAGTALANRLL